MNEAQTIAVIEEMALTPKIIAALSTRIETVWGDFADGSIIEAAGHASGALEDLHDEITRAGA